MTSILADFGLSPELDFGVLQTVWGDEEWNPDLLSSPAASLKKWLPLLPEPVSQQITLALNQQRPFLPADVTPEMMAEANKIVPSMNHMEIIYRCIDFAMKAADYRMASALVYVVDRACYRYGKSAALLHLVDAISHASPDTAIAPQVILRQARVMKDSGDLHTAMRVLDAVITKDRKWDYKSEEQYANTKAVCVQIKGQILHNLGLWKEAVAPLVESVHSFNMVRDHKGSSSSLALLSRCLKRMEERDYQDLRGNFAGVFVTGHPFYEAYQKGVEAVRLIESLGATVYVAHNQMVADESLLMFTIQHRHMTYRQKLDQYQVIVDEMTRSLANHHTVRYLQSLEVYLAFVRAVFLISLTLHFSPVPQDADLARFLEKLSLELYAYVCGQREGGGPGQTSSTLTQTQYSVRRMNGALALLGLPALEGSAEVEQSKGEKKRWSEAENPAKSGRVTSSESGESPSSGSVDGSSLTEESSLASSLPQSDSIRKEGRSADPDQSQAVKARTFPAVNPSKLQHGKRPVSAQLVKQKFVGLTMSEEDLRSATCPALATSVNQSHGEDGGGGAASQQQVDVGCLTVSADSIASATASTAPSDALHSSSDAASGSSGSPGAPLVSSSSNTGPSTSSEVSKATSSNSATVDRSASTKSTSSGSTDSWDGFTTTSSGLSPSGPSGPASSSSSHCSGPGAQSSGDTHGSGTVDQLVDTQPSSTSDSTGPQDGELSPLVDVSSACGLMAGLDLGSSVETSDSEEYLAHFVPSDNRDVHRAVLMIYNPLTGLWTAQTTLAYQGPLLKTATKGSHRDAFHVSFLHQDEPLGRYVGKRYRHGRRAPEVYMQDVVCQMLAGYYVTRFNQALERCPLDILQVQFLSAAHLQFLDKDGKVFDWINVEPYLHGSFLKLTNNLRFVSTQEKDERGVEVATALSHFSFAQTQGALMMVDLQGWTPADGKGVVFLTDPVFHTRNMKQFSSGDRHQEGMEAFWTNQHPRCNRVCRFLGLHKTRPDGGDRA